MHIANQYNHFRWYGRGPHENYPDRKQSAEMGIWSASVDEQYIPYPQPQETGTKVDIRWLTLTNSAGTGLLVVADQPIAASAIHFTASDLDKAEHTYELKRRNDVVLSLDAHHSGLGNASCGPGVLPGYEIPPEPAELHLSFRPCPAAANKEITHLARKKYDE